jgi:hypothetical protein
LRGGLGLFGRTRRKACCARRVCLDAANSSSFGCHLAKIASPRVRSDSEDARDTLPALIMARSSLPSYPMLRPTVTAY